MRGTESTGPPECRSTERSTDWGCFLKLNLLRVVTTSGWIMSNDLFDCRLACWSTIEADFVTRTHFKWLQSQVEYSRLAYFNSDLTRWSVALWASFSSRLFRKNEARMLSKTDEDWQRVEEPRDLILDVGNRGHQWGSVNNILWWGTLCKTWRKINLHIEWEREAQIVVSYFSEWQQQPTKGYKVALYSDWLRAIALHTIYIDSLNLDYPRDCVNTVIIHLYSTQGTIPSGVPSVDGWGMKPRRDLPPSQGGWAWGREKERKRDTHNYWEAKVLHHSCPLWWGHIGTLHEGSISRTYNGFCRLVT